MFSARSRWRSHCLTATFLLLGSLALAQSSPTSPTSSVASRGTQQQPASSPPPAAQSTAPQQAPAASTTQQNAPGNANPQAPAAASGSTAQQPQAEPDKNDSGMFVFKKQVEEVVLHATVLDDQRRPVPFLGKSAFTVYEDGVPQTITSFRREDVPVAMGIVIDNSGSMRDKRTAVNDAVMDLIQASNSEDEVFVVNFSQNYYLDQDFTSNANLLRAALHQVTMKGSTALYDAIVASAVHLENNPRLQKKVLLVITDGQDNMSQDTLEEAARQVERANGPILYAIGLTGSGLSNQGRAALQELADRTGGVAFFPDTLADVNTIAREIARDVRSQYIIAYRPRKQGEKPSFQSIRVDAHAPGYAHLIVRTQSGYFNGSSPK
jgi:Ca-activated chloride channel homolog